MAASTPSAAPLAALALLAVAVGLLAMLTMLLLLRWRRRIRGRGSKPPRVAVSLDPWREAGRRASPPQEERLG